MIVKIDILNIGGGKMMKKKIKVSPSSSQSFIGFIVGIIFCLLGLFLVIPQFGLFGVIWSLVAVVITISNGYNAFSNHKIASHEIIIEEEEEKYYSENHKKQTTEHRLQEIHHLYNTNLITKEEYEKKRKEILDEI